MEMPTVLIIYPHWPPSNLAGVHRARLIGNYLSEFGWHPLVLTVLPRYYEETPDPDLLQTVDPRIEVVHTRAYPVGRLRIVGDIGLRAFGFLHRKAKELIQARNISFVWIPVPSFYTALLGRLLYRRFKIPYGIDYIDPWVRDISNRRNLRAILSQWAARTLEPIAVKKASLISGVARKYYEDVLARNFKNRPVCDVAMPYGFDPRDHQVQPRNVELPWPQHIRPIVYAGAFLPNSYLFIKELFRQVALLHIAGKWPQDVRFYFLGTGAYTHKSISSYAQEAGISGLVTEIRSRFPFLHILYFLNKAWRVCIIGSTEAHYTASKTFQVLLSKRPVLAVFHKDSSACQVMQDCNAANYLVSYNSETKQTLQTDIGRILEQFLRVDARWNPDLSQLEPYSAKESARILAVAMNKITNSTANL